MTEPQHSTNGNLTERLIQQCASECVTAARDMIHTIRKLQIKSMGVLVVWWYRVFYTYTAAMVLVMSTLRPDIIPRSETHVIWEDALLLFKEHEHLSKSVQVCKATLQKMFSKIEETQEVSVSIPLPEENLPGERDSTAIRFPDFLQDFPFHLEEDPLFNFGNMAWLTNEQILNQ